MNNQSDEFFFSKGNLVIDASVTTGSHARMPLIPNNFSLNYALNLTISN
jgi:hypothetical protein